MSKDIKKSTEILKERNKLLDDANQIENNCKIIISAQGKLEKEEKNLQDKKKETEFLKNEEKKFNDDLEKSPEEQQIKMKKDKEKIINDIENSGKETIDD